MLIHAVLMEDFAGGEHRPFDDILQFPDVSGPGMADEVG